MKTSARNQLDGTVTAYKTGAVMHDEADDTEGAAEDVVASDETDTGDEIAAVEEAAGDEPMIEDALSNVSAPTIWVANQGQ